MKKMQHFLKFTLKRKQPAPSSRVANHFLLSVLLDKVQASILNFFLKDLKYPVNEDKAIKSIPDATKNKNKWCI